MQSILNRVPPDIEHVSVLSGEWMTVNAAAGLMGVSFRTLRRWARKHRVPVRMLGNVCVVSVVPMNAEIAREQALQTRVQDNV